jgi:hypothetical protein
MIGDIVPVQAKNMTPRLLVQGGPIMMSCFLVHGLFAGSGVLAGWLDLLLADWWSRGAILIDVSAAVVWRQIFCCHKSFHERQHPTGCMVAATTIPSIESI